MATRANQSMDPGPSRETSAEFGLRNLRSTYATEARLSFDTAT
jgi:hypothetical protein